MKKLFMIFCLSLFALSLNASGSVSEPCSENLPSATKDEELKVGDFVVRPNPCPVCGSQGWVVEAVYDSGMCLFKCRVCGHLDEA